MSSTGDYQWKGGEDQALEQLEAYCSRSGFDFQDCKCVHRCWFGYDVSCARMQVNFGDASSGNIQPHILPGLGSYQRTRNQLHVQCTSRLSPWMAIGCLSPRTVFWRAEQWHSCKADGHLDNWNSRNLSWTHMLDYLEAFRALNHHFLPAPLFSPWRFCSIFDISIAFCVLADMPYPPYPNTGRKGLVAHGSVASTFAHWMGHFSLVEIVIQNIARGQGLSVVGGNQH